MIETIKGALAALFLFVSPTAPHLSAPVGPQCTAVYPRGYIVPKITKKHPVCDNGIFGSTWRGCELRYQA